MGLRRPGSRMTEPNYEYVKGQGWVVCNFIQGPVITMRGGRKVRLEFRNPVKGERYDHGVESMYGTTDKPVISEWVRMYDNQHWAYDTMPLQDDHEVYDHGCYVVMVPLVNV
jgi:hypothetical protein